MNREPWVTRGLPARVRVNHGTGTVQGSGTVVLPVEFTSGNLLPIASINFPGMCLEVYFSRLSTVPEI